MSRQKLKRELLDALDKPHKFDPPPIAGRGGVRQRLEDGRRTISQARKRTFADEDTTEEKAKDEYRGIAERRVRLGLVLAEIGEKNKIKVTDDELSRAVVERARQIPGPGAGGLGLSTARTRRRSPSLRAPIFEDKVVDYILELAKVTEKTVSREELYKEDEA